MFYHYASSLNLANELKRLKYSVKNEEGIAILYLLFVSGSMTPGIQGLIIRAHMLAERLRAVSYLSDENVLLT